MSEHFVNIQPAQDSRDSGGNAGSADAVDWAGLRAEVFAGRASVLTTSKRLSELIVAAIRQGQLLPGRRLRETELSAALGASRTPLREALHSLKQQGILEADADSGLRVRLLSWRDVTELYELRGTLEGMSARLAARNASSAERDVIDRIHKEEKALMQAQAAARDLARLNHAFHQAILNGARNAFLQNSLNQQNQILILLGPTAYSLPSRQAEISDEHEAVCQAIVNRDEAAAQSAMHRHLHNALAARLAVMSAHLGAKDD